MTLAQQINKGVYSSSTQHLPYLQRCVLCARKLLKRLEIDVLGLVPTSSAHLEFPPLSEMRGVFELLRVRNRFGLPNPIGGYRDVNLKLRIGFAVIPKEPLIVIPSSL
jgi:hypothetical protein